MPLFPNDISPTTDGMRRSRRQNTDLTVTSAGPVYPPFRTSAGQQIYRSQIRDPQEAKPFPTINGFHCTQTFIRDGRVVRWCWVNFQCRGVLLIWIIVRQWPSALAGAGGGCLDIFLSSVISLSLSLSLSLGDDPILTKIKSQRAVKP